MCWLIPNPLFTVPEIPGPDVLQTSGSIPSIWAYFVKSTWEFFHNRLGWPSWAAVSTLDGQGFLGSRCVALSSRAEGSEKTAHLILSLYFRPRLTVQTCPLFHALGQIDLGALQPMRHISGLKEKKKVWESTGGSTFSNSIGMRCRPIIRAWIKPHLIPFWKCPSLLAQSPPLAFVQNYPPTLHTFDDFSRGIVVKPDGQRPSSFPNCQDFTNSILNMFASRNSLHRYLHVEQ